MDNHPDDAAATADAPPRRRSFLEWMMYGLGAAATALLGVPLVGYFLGTAKQPDEWVDLGPVSDFPLGETRVVTFDNPIRTPWDGIVARTDLFVRYEGKNESQSDLFRVMTVNCAHLGCPVSWFPQSGLFMCPCHGGVYYADGQRASGPPPRGLFHCAWRMREGKLQVQAPISPHCKIPKRNRHDRRSISHGIDGPPAATPCRSRIGSK